MNELVLANRAADWRRLKTAVLDRVSSPMERASGLVGRRTTSLFAQSNHRVDP
jgi:hypothetical protein